MNLEIINLREIFKTKYQRQLEEVNIYEMTSEEIIFYERAMNNSLKIYRYRFLSGELEIFSEIDLEGNASEEYIELEFIDGEDVYISTEDGGELVYFRSGKTRKDIFRGDYDLIHSLNRRYFIGVDELRNDLIDMDTGKVYEIRGVDLFASYMDGIRLIRLAGEEYLVYLDYRLDYIDFHEIYIDKNFQEDFDIHSRLQLIKFEDFLRALKAGEYVKFKTLYENEDFTYINPINPSYLNISTGEEGFYFSEIDYITKNYTVYRINEDMEFDQLASVNYDSYESPYNLHTSLNPFRIGKHSSTSEEYIYESFYPKEFIYRSRLDLNESVEGLIDDVIITSSWEENPDYIDYVNIRDKKTFDLIKRYRGRGILDEDNKRLVIF